MCFGGMIYYSRNHFQPAMCCSEDPNETIKKKQQKPKLLGVTQKTFVKPLRKSKKTKKTKKTKFS